MSSTETEHPNAGTAREYLEAFASGDLETAAARFDDDIVWRVGGYHRFSGTYRGRDAVLGYLREAGEEAGGTLALEAESILASDAHLAMFVRVRGERAGRKLDTNMAQIVKVGADGRWAEFWALSDDQDAIDAFWA